MKKTSFLIFSLSFIISLSFVLCACGKKDDSTETTELTGQFTAEEIAGFDEAYPLLDTLDASGSDCAEELYHYTVTHPGVKVIYDVEICGQTVKNDSGRLELSAESSDFVRLKDSIKYITGLKELELPHTGLDRKQIDELRETYPDVKIGYTVDLFGTELKEDSVSEMDVSKAGPSDVETLARVLPMIDSLEKVTVMDENGKTGLSLSDLGTLQQACPEVLFTWKFDLFGQTVSTADESLEYVKTEIGNEGLEQFRNVLPYLPRLNYLKLDNCGTDNTAMAELRDEFPDKKIVWRVWFGKYYTALTDAQMLRSCGGITKADADILKYCTDVEYIDFGHNEDMSDLSYVAFMPRLKAAIIADCNTESLEPFRNCKELQLLEIVNCWALTDLSPLAECESLRFLNMSNCYKVTDLKPLYGLQLERLFLGVNYFTDEQKAELVRNLPDTCWVTLEKPQQSTRVSYNYSIGWRLEEDGLTFSDWYVNLRKLFRYDEKYYSYSNSDGKANGTLYG